MVNLQNKIQQPGQLPGISIPDGCVDAYKRKLRIEEALTWEHTPFVHQGREKGLGGDCVAVLIGVSRKDGYDKKVGFEDIRNYKRMPDSDLMEKTLNACFDRIPLSEALPADILHLWFLQRPQHVAILLENHYIVHADQTVKKLGMPFGGVVVHRMDNWWWSRVVNVYRFRNI